MDDPLASFFSEIADVEAEHGEKETNLSQKEEPNKRKIHDLEEGEVVEEE